MYPQQIPALPGNTPTPTTTTTATPIDGLTHSGRHDGAENALVEIATTLGINPQGDDADVRARLDRMEDEIASLGSAPPMTNVLGWVYGASPGPLGGSGEAFDAADAPFPLGWGGWSVFPVPTLAEADVAAEGRIMAFFERQYGPSALTYWTVDYPAGYIPGSVLLRAAGPALIIERVGLAAAGDYTVSCTVDNETYGPITLRLS